jgi:hypothetical protein
MTRKHVHPFTMKPYMWTHGAAITKTDPAFRYRVFDDQGRNVAYITNTRASGCLAKWQISYIGDDRKIGDYATAEEALAAMPRKASIFVVVGYDSCGVGWRVGDSRIRDDAEKVKRSAELLGWQRVRIFDHSLQQIS